MLSMAALCDNDYWELELRGLKKALYFRLTVYLHLIWTCRSYDWQLVLSPTSETGVGRMGQIHVI